MTTVGARTTPTFRGTNLPTTARQVVRATILAVGGVCTLGFANLAWRRFVLGDGPLEADSFWLVGGSAAIVLLACLLRGAWLASGPVSPSSRLSPLNLVGLVAPSLFVWFGLAWLAGLAGSLLTVGAVLVVGVAEEVWALDQWRRFRRGRTKSAETSRSSVVVTTQPATPDAPATLQIDAELAEADEEEAWTPPGVFQQLTRGTDPERGEYVVGILRAEFQPGQRTQTLHVAFCPPLASVPHIAVQPIDGPPSSASVAQAEVFGARFELRLNRAWEQAQEVVLQFEAVGRR